MDPWSHEVENGFSRLPQNKESLFRCKRGWLRRLRRPPGWSRPRPASIRPHPHINHGKFIIFLLLFFVWIKKTEGHKKSIRLYCKIWSHPFRAFRFECRSFLVLNEGSVCLYCVWGGGCRTSWFKSRFLLSPPSLIYICSCRVVSGRSNLISCIYYIFPG